MLRARDANGADAGGLGVAPLQAWPPSEAGAHRGDRPVHGRGAARAEPGGGVEASGAGAQGRLEGGGWPSAHPPDYADA